MTVSKYNPPTQSTDTFPEYKDNIDGSIRVLGEIAANFAPRESDTPAMDVTLESGKLWDSESATYISQNLQTTSTITAPSTNPRIDRVAVNTTTGAFVIITGTEAASPVAPDYTNGQYPICQISLVVSQTTILNSDIIDERPLINLDGGGVDGIVSTADATAIIIDVEENVAIGLAALLTTATDGFFYMGSCAGTPTGVPTSKTGRIPIVIDTTNDKFYYYNTTWKVVGAGAGGAIPTDYVFRCDMKSKKIVEVGAGWDETDLVKTENSTLPVVAALRDVVPLFRRRYASGDPVYLNGYHTTTFDQLQDSNTRYSDDLSNATYWSQTGLAGLMSSKATLLNGRFGGGEYRGEDSATSDHKFSYVGAATVNNGSTYYGACFFRNTGIFATRYNYINIGGFIAKFDLANGTVGFLSAGVSARITRSENRVSTGYYLCEMYFTANAAGTSERSYGLSTTLNDSATSYLGNGFDGIGLCFPNFGDTAPAAYPDISFVSESTAIASSSTSEFKTIAPVLTNVPDLVADWTFCVKAYRYSTAAFSASRALFGLGVHSSTFELRIGLDTGKRFQFSMYNSNFLSNVGTTFADNTEYSIVFVNIGGVLKGYVNGIEQTATATNNFTNADDYGKQGQENLYLGATDALDGVPNCGTYDFKIYDRALSLAEIETL